MKTEPDFHPVASAWLDGRASQPEQSILREILPAEPGVMKEFAALCHTEVLLQQSGADAASRRESLAKLMSGRPLTKRAADLWKNRITRWSAAAALLTVAVWSMMRPGNDSDAISVAGKHSPTNAPLRTAVGGGRTSIKAGAKDQFPEAGLELLLKRFYMADFKAAASLPEAVALLVKDIHMTDGKSPGVEILDAGDAPVSLALNVSLPAWTLLQIMALQSGTTIKLTGQSIIFQRAENLSDKTLKPSKNVDFALLRTLLSPSRNSYLPGNPQEFGSLAERALGCRLDFSGGEDDHFQYLGSSKDVNVLEKALDATARPTVRIALAITHLTFPPETKLEGALADFNLGYGLSAILTEAQSQKCLREASQIKNVIIRVWPAASMAPNEALSMVFLHAVTGSFNEEITINEILNGNGRGFPGIMANIMAKPSGRETIGLSGEIGMELDPKDPKPRTNPAWKGKILIWDRQTVVFPVLKKPDDSNTYFFLSAHLVDPLGNPLPENSNVEAHFGDSNGKSLQERDAVKSFEPHLDIPAGIPSQETRGLVISPFAPEIGGIDLSAFKSGSQVQCPFTGKLFRKP